MYIPVILFHVCQEFFVLVLLTTWTISLDLQPEQPWDLVEFFGGRCKIARLAVALGLRATAVDILYDQARPKARRNRPGKRSPFDLNSDAGFAPLGLSNPRSKTRHRFRTCIWKPCPSQVGGCPHSAGQVLATHGSICHLLLVVCGN